MASLRLYECSNPNCNFAIRTEPEGHYALMSGHYLQFRCAECKKITSLSTEEIGKRRYNMRCDKCGESLSLWNPVEGKCPICNSPLDCNPNIIIMAD